MDVATSWIQIATLCAVITSGIGVPFILRSLARQDSDRQLLRAEMHEKFNHLDFCVDDLKKRVLSEGSTRADMLLIRAETAETANRMRLAISTEFNTLHERIMRLEDIALHKGE